jgi:hypothetical protein
MRKIFTLFFFVCFWQIIFGQQNYLIFRGGVSVMQSKYTYSYQNSSFNSNFYQNAERKSLLGISGGVALEVGLKEKEHWSFQPELLFTQKGMKIDGDGVIVENYRFNYLELPLLIKWNSTGKFGFFLNAGPAINFMINGKSVAETFPPFYPVGRYETPIVFRKPSSTGGGTYLSSRWDICLHAGGGVYYQLQRFQLQMEFRYSRGLTEITRDPSSEELRFINRNCFFSIGAAIPLKFKM